MSLRHYPTRLILLAIVFSLLPFGLCGAVAAYLAREQSRTAANLGEDIGSRGAADNLEATLNDLLARHDRQSRDVEVLHEQSRIDLDDIEHHADKVPEQILARQAVEEFDAYHRRWQERAPPAELAGIIREKVLPVAVALRVYNGRELRLSELSHGESLRRMAWGLVAVGGLGSLAGLILGYGLARSLRRTIHQFLVRVQGASDLLGQETSTIEWQPSRDGADDLLERVERVVSKLQQQEREVRRSERLAAVGQLAAGVAHEIRNPLTSAILLLETGRKDPTAGGLTDLDLDMIEAELHRIEQSLQLFLDYARPPKLERRGIDLATVVTEVVSLVRGRSSSQKVDVRVTAAADCKLDADSEQLRQVILNLILNALDVLPHGGTLEIDLQRIAAESAVELCVTDSGPGIAAEVLPRLFEPFATGKATGLGLGLVVSRRIVEDHGGTIRGFNGAGGACFVVRLPAEVRN